MTVAERARSAVERALAADDLELVLRGDSPYSIPEEYMAPSTVPTNWSAMIRNGLEAASRDDASVPARLEEALLHATGDAEGLYCALEFFRAYLTIRSRRPIFPLDVQRISDALRAGIAAHQAEIRSLHPAWLAPGEDLWERVVRLCDLIKDKHGIALR